MSNCKKETRTYLPRNFRFLTASTRPMDLLKHKLRIVYQIKACLGFLLFWLFEKRDHKQGRGKKKSKKNLGSGKQLDLTSPTRVTYLLFQKDIVPYLKMLLALLSLGFSFFCWGLINNVHWVCIEKRLLGTMYFNRGGEPVAIVLRRVPACIVLDRPESTFRRKAAFYHFLFCICCFFLACTL